MPAPGFALGIDLGTSNTVAVLRWPDGRVKPLLFDGSPLLPSAVYADPSGNLSTGRDAVHSARVDPSRYEPNPKRRIDDGSVLLGDTEVAVVDLFAAILSRVLEEARRTTGGVVPPNVTLTCPAAWAAPRRAVLTAAATRAGLAEAAEHTRQQKLRLVEEPVAAAAYFVNVLGRQVPIGSVVVVHDFGAGTFDASVVSRTGAGFEVLAVDGRSDIGGLDVDAAIVAHLGRQYAPRDQAAWARLASPSTVEDRRHRRLLWDDVRVAKERLSRAQAADLVLPVFNVDVHLTRDELERLAEPILAQTVQVTQGAMSWAKLAPGRLAGVFLVGGSSRIPLLATLLHRMLNEPPAVIEQPELVVAEGSLYAESTRPTDPSATVLSPRIGTPSHPLPGMDPVPRGGPAAPASPVRPTSAPPISTPSSGSTPAPGWPQPVDTEATTRLPASAPPASPVSGNPVSGNPMSGNPVSASPVSGSPVSPAYQQGRAALPPPQQPAAARTPRPPVMTPPTRPMPRTAPPPPPPPPRPAPAPQSRYKAGRRRPNWAVRALRGLFIMLLLVAAPVVSAYIAYKLALGEPLVPVTIDYPALARAAGLRA